MKTNLQNFKNLFDEMGIEYEVIIHAGNIKEMQIHPKHIYQNPKIHSKRSGNAVSIDFDTDDKFICFHGETI